jgi:hypothetical protein
VPLEKFSQPGISGAALVTTAFTIYRSMAPWALSVSILAAYLLLRHSLLVRLYRVQVRPRRM